MRIVAAFAVLLVSLSAGAEAQQVVDQSVYEQAYGQYPYYNRNNLQFTKYYFCVSNLNNCAASSFSNYCQTYDTTCNIRTPIEVGNFYGQLANLYCPAWCNKCGGAFNSVCPQTTPTTTAAPVQKCEYTEYTSLTSRLYNGQTAFQCQNPWSVVLKPNNVVSDPSAGYPAICQGALIDDRTVVTTLECIAILERLATNPSHYNVSLGEFVWMFDERQDETVTATLDLTFNPGTSGVAKLRLDKPILRYSKCVAPACLKSRNSAARIDRTKCRITGWGSTFNNGPPAPILRTGNVVISSDAECSGILSFLKTYPSSGLTLNYVDEKFVGCTSAPQSQSSACRGDEGGAVTCAEETTGDQILVGLIKTGGCNTFNGTFFANITTLF